jgi:hypothetical protein
MSFQRRAVEESRVYGPGWNTVHGGYFSDASVAGVFIDSLLPTFKKCRPDIVVDLAGGTGFLLYSLVSIIGKSGARFINIDVSQRQLGCMRNSRIEPLRKSIRRFRRKDLGGEDIRILFMMRSALHYFGREGLRNVLAHLRSQMREGEYFVHQTACFDQARDGECINYLYERMGTDKWYPATGVLCERLGEAGLRVKSLLPAPALTLSSLELAHRYRLSRNSLLQMRNDIVNRHGEKQGLFVSTPDGFRGFLHYKVFTCQAVPLEDKKR